MRRALKLAAAVLAGAIVLAILNAVALSAQTREAEVTVEGATLIETSVGTVQVLDEGPRAGPAVVLLHCFTCSMRWWDRVTPLLAARNRVVRVDLLGHGGSEKPKGTYSVSDQATAVIEATSSLGVNDATVVGHSLGGAVAVAMVERSPELAARVMTVGTRPTSDIGSLSLTARAASVPVIGQALHRFADLAPATFLRDQLDQAFAPGFSTARGFANPDQPVDDYRELTYAAYDSSQEGFEDYVGATSLPERLDAAAVPAVVVFGTEDQIIPPEEEAAAAYATSDGVEAVVLERTGHSPHVEDPERLAPLVLELVAEGVRRARREAQEEARRRAAEERRQRQARERRRGGPQQQRPQG